jgi:hypothetical protein
LSFELQAGGKPRLYYTPASGTDVSYIFNADVRTGDWAHLTITNNQQTGELICYIDGVAVATMTGAATYGNINPSFLLGGDFRGGNAQFFKGLIRSISLYSDVRTAAEVQSDYKNGTSTTADNLLAHYNMPKSGARADVKDLSGNGKDADFYITWFEDKAEVTGYEYSLALVGDTQIINERDMMNGTTVMDGLYQWIVDNTQSKKMAQVIGLGDITDSGDYSDQEWDHALATISKLDEAGIPYTLIRGNHDETGKYNEHFGFGSTSGYLEQFTKAEYYGFYKQDKIESSFKTFTAGSTEYLILTLDYGADDAELGPAEVDLSFPEFNHPVHRTDEGLKAGICADEAHGEVKEVVFQALLTADDVCLQLGQAGKGVVLLPEVLGSLVVVVVHVGADDPHRGPPGGADGLVQVGLELAAAGVQDDALVTHHIQTDELGAVRHPGVAFYIG